MKIFPPRTYGFWTHFLMIVGFCTSNARTPLSLPLKELLMNCVECMKTTGGASKTCHNPSISSIDPLLSFVPPHMIFYYTTNRHSPQTSFQKQTSNFYGPPHPRLISMKNLVHRNGNTCLVKHSVFDNVTSRERLLKKVDLA